MLYSQEDEEKNTAFRGMCSMIAVNPNGIVHDFFYFCKAISSWDNPRPDLKEQFVQVHIFFFLNIASFKRIG